MRLANVAVLWTAVSVFVSPFLGGWLARRPAELTSAGLGTMGDRGTAAPLDP
ncbi:MAG: hypothetical protein ACJ739_01800 [Acidimicrobiales bacterium]